MATGNNLSRSTDPESEEIHEFSCTPCSKNSKNVEAIKFCVECGEYFCSTCFACHDNFAALRGHQLLDRTAMKQRQGSPSSTLILTERCSIHDGKILEMFCRDHKVICCVVCIAIDHRLCQGIEYLLHTVKGFKTSLEYSQIKSDAMLTKSDLEKLRSARLLSQTKFDSKKSMTMSRVRSFREEANKLLDDMEHAATDQVCKMFAPQEDRIQEEVDAIDKQLLSLDTTIDEIDPNKEENEYKLFANAMKCKCTVKQYSENDAQEMSNGTVDIIPNVLTVKSIETFRSKIESLAESFNGAASLAGEYNVKLVDDKSTCDINGSCQLSDGTVLITDWNNKRLKRLSNSYVVTDHCDFRRSPYEVASTGPREVAVTLTSERKIQFVSVKVKLRLTRSIKVGELCRGLAYKNDELFVCCGGQGKKGEGPGQVRVYDLSGILLQTILKEITPLTLAVSYNSTDVYITDTKGLLTMDRHGKRQWNFTDPDMKSLRGICVTENTIFASGFYSNNVTQIDKDGRKIGVILEEKDGINLPQALLYDRLNDRFIILMRDTDYIKMFDLVIK